MNYRPQENSTMYDSVAALTEKIYTVMDQRNGKEEEIDLKEIIPVIDLNSSVVTTIYNHASLKYEYFSPSIKNMLGFDHTEFMEGGLKFAMSRVLPEHNKLFNKNIIPIMVKYYLKYAIKRKVLDLKFSYTFKIQKKDGEYIWALHHMSALKTTRWGTPKYTLIFISDITELKRDENVDIVISLKNEEGLYKPIYTRTYNGFASNFKFSPRELEILILLARGKTSRDIAKDLNLSTHTIYTHRKNMLEKSKMKNTSELVYTALSKGFINELPNLKISEE